MKKKNGIRVLVYYKALITILKIFPIYNSTTLLSIRRI